MYRIDFILINIVELPSSFGTDVIVSAAVEAIIMLELSRYHGIDHPTVSCYYIIVMGATLQTRVGVTH